MCKKHYIAAIIAGILGLSCATYSFASPDAKALQSDNSVCAKQHASEKKHGVEDPSPLGLTVGATKLAEAKKIIAPEVMLKKYVSDDLGKIYEIKGDGLQRSILVFNKKNVLIGVSLRFRISSLDFMYHEFVKSYPSFSYKRTQHGMNNLDFDAHFCSENTMIEMYSGLARSMNVIYTVKGSSQYNTHSLLMAMAILSEKISTN